MKILLYYPPLIVPSIARPYPSLPILSGYLKDNTEHEVICKDINADLINKLIDFSKSKGVKFKRISPVKYSTEEQQSFLSRLKNTNAYSLLRLYYKKIFWSRNYRSMDEVDFFVLAGLKMILKDLSIDIETFNQLKGNDSQLVFKHYLFDHWNLTYEQLEDVISGEQTDPIYGFLGGGDYFKEIEAKGKKIIGISVAFFTQFGAAIALAKYVKKIDPKAFVVIGGAAIRHVSRNFNNIPIIFDIVDCFIETEGEDVLVELSNRIDKGEDWQDVAGLIYKNTDNRIIKNKVKIFNINKSNVPDYTVIDNHRYLEPADLYLRTSIGCYWNKCKFCTQSFNKYQQRSIDDITDDMKTLIKKYGVKRIQFSDEAVPAARLSKIADRLIEKNISVKWYTYSRFDTSFTDTLCEKLVKSGCEGLNFGLEAASQRVNDLMNKGVNIKKVQEVIELLKKHGLICNMGAMIGFPGETEEEMLETVDFLRSNSGSKVFSGIAIFSLNYGSYVYYHPQEFGITDIDQARDYFYKESLDFKCKKQVSYEKMMAIKKMI